jgi:hypothetical protein
MKNQVRKGASALIGSGDKMGPEPAQGLKLLCALLRPGLFGPVRADPKWSKLHR